MTVSPWPRLDARLAAPLQRLEALDARHRLELALPRRALGLTKKPVGEGAKPVRRHRLQRRLWRRVRCRVRCRLGLQLRLRSLPPLPRGQLHPQPLRLLLQTLRRQGRRASTDRLGGHRPGAITGRSYGRATDPGTSACALPMALSLSAEGPRLGAKGSGGSKQPCHEPRHGRSRLLGLHGQDVLPLLRGDRRAGQHRGDSLIVGGRCGSQRRSNGWRPSRGAGGAGHKAQGEEGGTGSEKGAQQQPREGWADARRALSGVAGGGPGGRSAERSSKSAASASAPPTKERSEDNLKFTGLTHNLG